MNAAAEREEVGQKMPERGIHKEREQAEAGSQKVYLVYPYNVPWPGGGP